MPASHDYTDSERGPRLQKVLAAAGIGSRRGCEELIELGDVKVNGQVVKELPAWVDPENDKITVAGARIDPAVRNIYIMLFKPRGVITTNDDPEGRRRAIDLVQHPSGARLFSVGRLDLDSSGLLLLTNDGELANKLTHPRYGVHRTYEVTVRGSLSPDQVKELERGIYLFDRRKSDADRTRGVRLKLIKRDRERTRLLMELREGRNRQIRRMMVSLGHPVKKLRRVSMGPLKLKGLAVGEWRELTAREIASLKRAPGAKGRSEKSKSASKKKRTQPGGRVTTTRRDR